MLGLRKKSHSLVPLAYDSLIQRRRRQSHPQSYPMTTATPSSSLARGRGDDGPRLASTTIVTAPPLIAG